MFRLICLVIFMFFAFTASHAKEATTLAEAKALSAKTNKPILLDFMTEW